ncbi:DNA methyltransferase [Serinibacter salmoneus]|uniref:DNA modification methylase n=1 Tax=Serinibacter salmoneus TaxID=556530 RepID=A0A2A9D1N6_9MICO|nr:DNA methyltransferase [Serinibacter salmoneus]PFG19862.1 DNA modification methylase [Serinibacter salmoneus]
MIPSTLTALSEPIDSLRPYAKDPRRADVEAVAASLAAHGQYRPVVARVGTREVLAGNGVLSAARTLGWEHLAVTWVDVDDDGAARINLVDNRTSDLATYDDAALLEVLTSLPDLSGTGYDDAALAALLSDAEGDPVGLTDEDEPAPLPAEPVSQLGDVWELDGSLVLCGDSTDTEAVLGALAGRVPDCMWTDPPYGVAYVGGTSENLTILNDKPEDLPDLLSGAFATAVAVCRPGAPVYVAYATVEGVSFETSLRGAGVDVRQHLVWVKPSLVLSRADYHYRHEPILHGTTPEPGEGEEPTTHEGVAYGFTGGGSGRLGRGGPNWYGDDRQTTVFEVPKPKRNAEHPTMKPVELVLRMLANSCPRGGLVLDLFGGSGTTLIAAWHHRAKAALVELDPKYVDAICLRWQLHTGHLPVRRSTGEPVDFTKAKA